MAKSPVVKALALALGVLAPQAALAERVGCSIDPNSGGGGWIPPQIIYDINGGTAQATLPWFDGEVHTVQAEISNNTDRRLTIQFRMFATDSAQQRTHIIYRGSYFRQTNEFRITANPAGYANRFSARGACQVM